MNKFLRLGYSLNWLRIAKFKLRYGKHFIITKCWLGKGTNIEIQDNGIVSIGQYANLTDFCYISCIGGFIRIGEHTYMNKFCKLDSWGEIEIGNNCLFGTNVSIFDSNHIYKDLSVPIKYQGLEIKKVCISDDVWIGANVVITAGVTIGSHVVVGANSVVTHDLPSNGLYGGVPAKLIKLISKNEDAIEFVV